MMDDNKQHNWERYFTQRWFAFGQQDQTPYVRDMILAEGGKIENYAAHNETFWEVKDNELHFLSLNHEISTVFPLPDNPSAMNGNTLIGTYMFNPSVKHQLVARNLPESLYELKKELTDNLNDRFYQATLDVTPAVKKIKTHSRIRVAFIINSVETLPALLPLMKALQADDDFESKILMLDKFYYNTAVLPTLKEVTAFIAKQGLTGIPIEQYYDDVLRELRLWQPDFIIRQSQWDGDYPSAFSADRLDWARMIHIPYTITEKMTYAPNQQTGSMLTNHYYQHIWRYFTAEPLSDNEKQAIAASFVSEDTFQAVGSMKAKMIEHAKPNWPINHGGKRILWTAHHSINNGWFKFGTLPKIYQSMLAWTKAHQELSVLFNPHPLLREVIATEPTDMTLDQYDQFLRDFAALPNAGVWEHKPQYQVSAAADVVLTDGYSAFYEMQIQRKPVVALLRSDHTAFTPEGKQLLRGLHVRKNIHDAQDAVLRLLRDPDDKRKYQIANTQTWLINEHPEQKIMQAMRKEMEK
ncbi:hypothetical protein [Lacticaseibacillus rhamnosus]|nr:hypothetical protein [Lacticaseibacillus rhamnosus]